MKIPSDLARFGLEHAKKPLRRRLVMTGEGGPGTGKTDLFYRTAPRPALVIQIDLNDEGIRERYASDDIVFKNIVMQPFLKHDEAQRIKDMAVYVELRDLFNISVTKDYFRSVMIDEGMVLYSLVRRSFLTDLSFGGEKQQAYEPVNAAMARFYTLAKQHRVNLYIPHRQKDERKKNGNYAEATGNKVYAGWKDALYESQCHVLFSKDPTFNPQTCDACDMSRPRCVCDKFKKKNPVDKFELTIIKCTANTKVEGMMLTGADINWPTIGTLVFPHSDESDWK